jgi:hypothetical protein
MNTPFSQGWTIKYQLAHERFFFTASWTAYMAVGFSALGNGPLHNDVGVLSESFANPNTAKYAVGRLDNDRAYIARLFLSYKLNKKLSVAFQGYYKDGQPLANFDSYFYSDENGTQLALQNYRTKAQNPMNLMSGSRKDSFFNTELRVVFQNKLLNGLLEANLTIYNIYDFGTELAEYTFSPSGNSANRYSLELNIPRGAMITLMYKF